MADIEIRDIVTLAALREVREIFEIEANAFVAHSDRVTAEDFAADVVRVLVATYGERVS